MSAIHIQQVQWLMATFQLVALFCLIRSIDDFRKKRCVWAGLGLLATAFLLLTPMQTHTVKIDLARSSDQ
ncbi:MAG: hypothetical protein C0494_14395 [Sphingobium sp.]|nr:hypothetical protein [Sphingobium sp.]